MSRRRQHIVTLYIDQHLIQDVLAHFSRETTDPSFRDSVFSAWLKEAVDIQKKIITTLSEQPKLAEEFRVEAEKEEDEREKIRKLPRRTTA